MMVQAREDLVTGDIDMSTIHEPSGVTVRSAINTSGLLASPTGEADATATRSVNHLVHGAAYVVRRSCMRIRRPRSTVNLTLLTLFPLLTYAKTASAQPSNHSVNTDTMDQSGRRESQSIIFDAVGNMGQHRPHGDMMWYRPGLLRLPFASFCDIRTNTEDANQMFCSPNDFSNDSFVAATELGAFESGCSATASQDYTLCSQDSSIDFQPNKSSTQSCLDGFSTEAVLRQHEHAHQRNNDGITIVAVEDILADLQTMRLMDVEVQPPPLIFHGGPHGVEMLRPGLLTKDSISNLMVRILTRMNDWDFRCYLVGISILLWPNTWLVVLMAVLHYMARPANAMQMPAIEEDTEAEIEPLGHGAILLCWYVLISVVLNKHVYAGYARLLRHVTGIAMGIFVCCWLPEATALPIRRPQNAAIPWTPERGSISPWAIGKPLTLMIAYGVVATAGFLAWRSRWIIWRNPGKALVIVGLCILWASSGRPTSQRHRDL